MKIGMIFECGPDGADQQVCEHLAHRLLPGIDVDPIPLGNKPGLLSGCGPAAANLLQQGCERIIIVWDLYPSWGEELPCRKEDCEKIQASLSKFDVPMRQVDLVCIEQELEAWLLADGRALATVLSRPTHPVRRVQDVRNPDQESNPKARLKRNLQSAPWTALFGANTRKEDCGSITGSDQN